MAFIDIGDQFIALAEGRKQTQDGHRHFGLVVDDKQAALQAAREAGAELNGNTFSDPWGNNVQIVAYADVQFTKTPEILNGMGVGEPREVGAGARGAPFQGPCLSPRSGRSGSRTPTLPRHSSAV